MVFTFACMRRLVKLLVRIFSLSVVQAQAQNLETFSHRSVNDGLSQSTIYTIYQDSKGFIWFGTRGGGLNRYNGYEFQVERKGIYFVKLLNANQELKSHKVLIR